MTTTTIEQPDSRLTAYQQYNGQIAIIVESYSKLTINGLDDKDGIEAVEKARKHVKKILSAVEKTRKELKADSLEYGRKVDAEAKRISGLLEPTKLRLESEEAIIQQELARIAEEKREATRKRNAERVEKFNAIRKPFVPEELYSWSDNEFDRRFESARLEFEAAENVRKEEESRRIAEQARMQAEREELERQRKELEAEKRKMANAQAAADIEKLKSDIETSPAPVPKQETPEIDWSIDLPDVIKQIPEQPTERIKRESIVTLATQQVQRICEAAKVLGNHEVSQSERNSAARLIDTLIQPFVIPF